MLYAENPIRHVAISPPDLEEMQRTLIRGNATLRSYSDSFRDAYWLLVKHNRASFGGSKSTFAVLREFKTRLFLPRAHRDSINHVNLKISHDDMGKMEILRKFTLPRCLPVVRGRKTLTYGFIRVKFDRLRSAMTREEVAKVDAVAAIEWDLVQGFSRLATRLNKKMSSRCTSVVDQAELYQVGYIALVDAIWAYDRPGTLFKSFAYGIMLRRLKRFLNVNGDGGKAAATGNEKLLGAYYQALTLDREHDHFDDVVERIRYRETIREDGDIKEIVRPLTDQEIEKLRAVFTNFHRYHDTQGDSANIHDIADHIEGVDFKGMEFSEIIRQAKLSPGESDMIELALMGEVGFRTRWAATHADPKTGKSFSRMTACNTYDRAIKKIRAVECH